jgi:S1-C subfamily serine protease
MRFVITAAIGEAGLNMKMMLLSACVLIIASTTAEAADTFSGSGVVIGTQGEILTNAHVVEACTEITVRFPPGNLERGVLLARDEKNDLAAIRAPSNFRIPRPPFVATFRDGPVRAGDVVVALGYPLSGLLASTANLSVGNVSALAGLRDDSRYLQISAPVQPGNSGGPLLDTSGHVIGIVTAKLNAARVAKFTGDIPQNVNFALKVDVARTFLDSKGIAYRKAPSDQQLSAADVGDIARPFTVHIQCKQDALQSAAPVAANPPSRTAVTSEQLSWCKGRAFRASPDLKISGCTAVIQSGRWTGNNLAQAYNWRGIAYGIKGDYDRAITDYNEAIRLDPKNPRAFLNRGMMYYGFFKDYDRAIFDFTETLRLNPNDSIALHFRNRAYEHLAAQR